MKRTFFYMLCTIGILSILTLPLMSFSAPSPYQLLPEKSDVVIGLNFKHMVKYVEKNSVFGFVKNARQYKEIKTNLSKAGININKNVYKAYAGGFLDKNGEVEGITVITGIFNEKKINITLKKVHKNMKIVKIGSKKNVIAYKMIKNKDTYLAIYKGKYAIVGNLLWVNRAIVKLEKNIRGKFKSSYLNKLVRKSLKNRSDFWVVGIVGKKLKVTLAKDKALKNFKYYIQNLRAINLQLKLRKSKIATALDIYWANSNFAKSFKNTINMGLTQVNKQVKKKNLKATAAVIKSTKITTKKTKTRIKINTNLGTLSKLIAEVQKF